MDLSFDSEIYSLIAVANFVSCISRNSTGLDFGFFVLLFFFAFFFRIFGSGKILASQLSWRLFSDKERTFPDFLEIVLAERNVEAFD